MRILIAGGTGMVGKLLLQLCLNNDGISEVVSLVRKPTGIKHSKLIEIEVSDFINYTNQGFLFQNINCAFFCIGVYTGQVSDEKFRQITVDYAVSFATNLKIHSPNATICMLSGYGADRTEKSRASFARYKGMAENRIAALNLKLFSFRPSYIYPIEPRTEPNIGYRTMRFLYPLLRLFGEKYSIKSTELADAIFNVGLNGADKQILENKDILRYTNIG